MGAQKRLISDFVFFALHVWNLRNERTFAQNLFYPYNLTYIFVPAYGLLEYPRKVGFRPIFGRFSIPWRIPAFLRFGGTVPDLPAFLPKNCIFWDASVELIKIRQRWSPKSYKGFINPPILLSVLSLTTSTLVPNPVALSPVLFSTKIVGTSRAVSCCWDFPGTSPGGAIK